MWRWMMVLSVVFSAHLVAEIKVLAFSGSTREDSVNKKLVCEAANFVRQSAVEPTVIDLKNFPMPFYDADLEAKEGMPSKAKELRRLMIQSNVILIASPEYNGSLSGVLKNAIDWASRNEEGQGSRDAFKGKTFVLMSASPGQSGGARGLVHLRTILENIGGIVSPQQVVLSNAYLAFDEKGCLKDEKIQKELQELIRTALIQKTSSLIQ